MQKEKIFFELGDMSAYYILDRESDQAGFGLVPSASKGMMVEGRRNFEGDPEIEELPEEWRPTVPRGIFSLAQVRCAGDAAHEGPFGRSMLHGQTSNSFKLISQELERNDAGKSVHTVLEAENGLQCDHHLLYSEGTQRIVIQTSYLNTTDKPVTIELASSFSFSDLSPFDETCSHDRLYLHRFKTFWSREGRHVTDSIHDLQLSPSWHVAHFANEKFGQVGSWSTNGWYPQLVLEDKIANVMWGARLAWSGSWQMELFRCDDQISIAGGLADYDTGHWKKVINPGETFKTPDAYVTTCAGDIDDVCNRLVDCPDEKREVSELPILFNDWCANWGTPSEESIQQLVSSIQPLECDYFIIDAGWYKPESGNWNMAHGDWVPSKILFPDGLKSAADIIKSYGLKPGIWFEYETVGVDSTVFHKKELLLHCDGLPVQTGARRFLDFRNKEVIDYLDEKVIKTLKDAGFNYLKLDYNSSIGKGADGAESLGESLRQHLLEAAKYLRRIRSRVPGITIENCASGGMRMDPFSMSLCDLGSFSDAHASPEIPIIAANLHRLIHPSKSLVWAVIRAKESIKRIHYSLAATFLGSPCISGDINKLDDHQFEVVKKYLKFYRKIDRLVLHGQSRILGNKVDNYRAAKGSQVVIRENVAMGEALLVCHSFNLEDEEGREIVIETGTHFRVENSESDGVSIEISNHKITIAFSESWSGGAFHLSKEK